MQCQKRGTKEGRAPEVPAKFAARPAQHIARSAYVLATVTRALLWPSPLANAKGCVTAEVNNSRDHGFVN